MDELKSCPFCGGEAFLVSYPDEGRDFPKRYAYRCNKCKANGPANGEPKWALMDWNERRVEQAPLFKRRSYAKSPAARMADTLNWISANPKAWALIVATAKQDVILRDYKHIHVKRYIEEVRLSGAVHETDGYKINNNYAPYIARILIAWYPELEPHIVTRKACGAEGLVVPAMETIL